MTTCGKPRVEESTSTRLLANDISFLRDAGVTFHKEVLYTRRMQAGVLPAGDKRRKASSVVVQIIKANKQTYGFEGWIGLVTGHPMLLNHLMASEQAVSRSVAGSCSFEDFCLTLNGGMTLKDAREAWEKRHSGSVPATQGATPLHDQPPAVSVVSVSDSQSLSSVSFQSSVTSPRRSSVSISTLPFNATATPRAPNPKVATTPKPKAATKKTIPGIPGSASVHCSRHRHSQEMGLHGAP